MKPKFHLILEHAIELGVISGVRRAYKHSDNPYPSQDQIDAITQGVWDSIHEWFDYENCTDE